MVWQLPHCKEGVACRKTQSRQSLSMMVIYMVVLQKKKKNIVISLVGKKCDGIKNNSATVLFFNFARVFTNGNTPTIMFSLERFPHMKF